MPEAPQYPGLTFKEWMFYAPDENQPVGVNFSVQLNAVYDKLLVRFLVNEELVGLDTIYGPADEETSDIVYSQMVFIDAGVIQENGDVSLTFSHASDYVLVMADTVMSGTGAADPTIQKSVKTGDTTSFFMIFALLVVSAGAAAVILYRRKVK